MGIPNRLALATMMQTRLERYEGMTYHKSVSSTGAVSRFLAWPVPFNVPCLRSPYYLPALPCDGLYLDVGTWMVGTPSTERNLGGWDYQFLVLNLDDSNLVPN